MRAMLPYWSIFLNTFLAIAETLWEVMYIFWILWVCIAHRTTCFICFIIMLSKQQPYKDNYPHISAEVEREWLVSSLQKSGFKWTSFELQLCFSATTLHQQAFCSVGSTSLQNQPDPIWQDMPTPRSGAVLMVPLCWRSILHLFWAQGSCVCWT